MYGREIFVCVAIANRVMACQSDRCRSGDTGLIAPFEGFCMSNRSGMSAMCCGMLAVAVGLSGCGSSALHHTARGSGTSAHSSSSPVSTGSLDSVATSASPSVGISPSPQTKHLLQAGDLPTKVRIQLLTQVAIEQAAEEIEGAASPVAATTTRPACTTVVNSGRAAHPVDPDLVAGEAIVVPGTVFTEIIVPSSIAREGIRIGQQQQRACVGATITETVNGVKVVTKPQFRTGPHDVLIMDSTVTSPGKRPLYESRAIEIAGGIGIAFSSQSTTPIQSATINDYLNRAATRATH